MQVFRPRATSGDGLFAESKPRRCGTQRQVEKSTRLYVMWIGAVARGVNIVIVGGHTDAFVVGPGDGHVWQLEAVAPHRFVIVEEDHQAQVPAADGPSSAVERGALG